MKFLKISSFLFIAFLVLSCGKLKAPEYKGVGEVKVSEVINDSIVVNAMLHFNNPNKVGGNMVLEDLHATINAIDLGYLKSQKVKIPSKKDFSVPLELKLSYGQVFDSKKGLLGSILNSILTNHITVKVDGKATFSRFLIKKEYPISFLKKVKIIQ